MNNFIRLLTKKESQNFHFQRLGHRVILQIHTILTHLSEGGVQPEIDCATIQLATTFN